MIGCSNTPVQTRVPPEVLGVQARQGTQEFEICHPSIGAWKCDAVSPKTPIHSTKRINVIDRSCLQQRYDAGSIAGEFLGVFEFKYTGQYDLTKSQLRRIKNMAKDVKNRQIVVFGFTEKGGSIKTNRRVAYKRAENVSLALQQFGIPSHMISIEGQASRCSMKGINNKRALIFEL